MIFWKLALFLFIGKQAPNLVDTKIELFSFIGHSKKSTCSEMQLRTDLV